MEGDSGRRARPAPVTCAKDGCSGRANQHCTHLLCSVCCRAAGNKCKTHAPRPPQKPKTPESPALAGNWGAFIARHPKTAPPQEAVPKFGPLRVPDAEAPGTPERGRVASPKAPSVEIGSAGNAKVGGDEIGLAGGKGWSVRKAGVGTTPEKLESVVPRDHDSERGGLLAPEEPDKGEPMVAERQAGGLVQEPEAVPRLSGRVEPSPSNEASATPEDSPEHVGLSQAEMCALWNEDVEEQPRAQELGGAGLFTPEGSQGGQPQSVEQGPSLGSFAGRESLVGGWQGSGLGVDVRRSESPESSAAEQELFLRISSQRSPFAPPVLPSSGFLRETQGLGAVPSLGRDSLPAHLSNLSAWKDSPRTVDSGSAGADFYRQLAHTLTPDRAAAFASGTGGVSAAATGGLVRDSWSVPGTQPPLRLAGPASNPSLVSPTGGLLQRYQLDLQTSHPTQHAFPRNRDPGALSPSPTSTSAEPSGLSGEFPRGFGHSGAALGSPGLERRGSWPVGHLEQAALLQPRPLGSSFGSAGFGASSPPAGSPLLGGHFGASPQTSVPLGSIRDAAGRGWMGGLGSGAGEQGASSFPHAGPAAKRMRPSSETLPDFASSPPTSPPKPAAKKRARKEPTKLPSSPPLRMPTPPSSGLPPPPAPIPSAPVLASLAPESLPPASIPILLMQLQALRKTVPPQLQDQVLASNRPLRILADALEAQSRSNAGGGAGSKAEERGEGDRPTQIPARLENLATGIMPRLGNLVGLGLEKEAGVGVGGADRGPRTAPAENQGGFAALHKQGFPENNRLRGESSEYIGLGAAEGRLSQSTERAANTVGRPKLVGRPLSLAEGGNKVLPTVTLHGSLGKIDSLRNEELFAKAALVVRGAIKPDTGAGSINTASLVREAEKILAGGISDTSSEKNSGWGLAETDMGATIRSQGLPSLRDSEMQWSAAVGRKPDLDDGSAVTTEESVVDRALHRLRETTLLMQHLLPPPRAPALGGASLQDRENSVYTTARDTLQEAATWAAPIGRGVEQTGSAEEGSILSSSAHRGDPRGGPQGGAGGVPEEDVMQDEELAARVDDLRRQLQRLEDAPAGVEVLQQILNFDQAQTAGLGLTDEQLERRATSLQRKTAPGLPTTVGPAEKRKPHQVVTSFSDLV